MIRLTRQWGNGGGTEGLTEGIAVGDRRADDAPLLEREEELARLGTLLSRGRAGTGRVLLIEGPAGIGKTRLLTEARSSAERLGFEVFPARGGELEREYGFGIVRQLLESPVARADPAERRVLLSGAAELAEAVVSPSPSEMPGAADTTQSVLHGLYWLVVNLSERSPLLLAVDDLHWVDGPSLRFLLYLARRLDGLPVVLLLARRTGEASPAPELLRALGAEAEPPVLRPGALSPLGVENLVRAHLGRDAPHELCRACHEATGGNPFLLVELLHDLRSDRRPPSEIDPAAVGRLASERIATASLLRVGRLGAPAAALARAVAVLGESAEVESAAALAEIDSALAGSLANALVEAGLLEPGRPLRFVHPLVRNAIYEDATRAERSALHFRAAEQLADAGERSEAAAAHLLLTEPSGRDGVVELLRAGAHEAAARGAPETAVRYLRRALEEPPSETTRPMLMLELGTAAARAGEPDSIDLLREAFRLTDQQPARAVAGLRLAAALDLSSTEVAEAISVFERALEGLQEPELRARLEAMIVRFGMGMPVARARLARRMDEARRKVDRLPERYARMLLSPLAVDLAITGGTAGEVARLAERALAGGELMNEDLASDSALAIPAVGALVWCGRLETAKRVLDEALAKARARGSPVSVAQVSALRALAHQRMGALDDAEADARTSLELSAEASWGILHTLAVAVLAAVLVERGDLEAAREALALIAPDPTAEEVMPNQALRESRAKLLMAAGDPGGALEVLRAYGRWEERWRLGPSVVPVPWRSAAAMAHLHLGEISTARELAEQELLLARDFGAAPQLGNALRVVGRVEGGHRGLERLKEAVSLLEGSVARLEHARALVDLGALLRRSGERNAATERLREGMQVAHRCGATALVEAAAAELRLAGARPRRIALSGPDALTPGERRVADLAADGMTNKEIAQALFVTLRTVEMHLSNAYRKLGISSRAELPSALGQPAS
jgi:DNA-binding CsgD family transcriptional regulator